MTKHKWATYQVRSGLRTGRLMDGRLAYWLGLPWRCKFCHAPVERQEYEPNTGYLYQSWFDCERCGNYLSAGVFRG